MIDGIQNIFRIPELKKRLLYTFGLLAVYRVGAFIPTPGIDSQALARYFENVRGTILGFFNMFSGGALEQMAVFALGIMPYISASIILELLTVVVPYLEKLKKEGEQGRKKINRYTRYGTVVLSMIQGLGIAIGLEHMEVGGASIVPAPGWAFEYRNHENGSRSRATAAGAGCLDHHAGRGLGRRRRTSIRSSWRRSASTEGAGCRRATRR